MEVHEPLVPLVIRNMLFVLSVSMIMAICEQRVQQPQVFGSSNHTSHIPNEQMFAYSSSTLVEQPRRVTSLTCDSHLGKRDVLEASCVFNSSVPIWLDISKLH